MKNNKKGFSLVELVIVIAILVVLLAVLAPSLMTYTERSRAQKDVTTMDEVVNAVQLAMADQKCYDEMIKYSCNNNFITYSDSSGNYGQQVIDGEFWAPDGSGRATTITFNPTRKGNETFYVLETAIINDMTYGNGSVAENRVMQGAQTESNQCYFKNAALNSDMDSYTYNRVRQIVGDSTIATSATYANSSFTIFIRFNQKDGVTVADVNGAFNGTNLTANSSASKGSGTSTYDPDTGKANPTVTNPGTTNTNYTGSALGGTGSFSGGINPTIEDYKQPTYIENLQKEHKFEYYSSASLAAKDISNNSIGENADCDKPDAIAGIYTDDQGIPGIVILKDYTENETINLEQKANVLLGGKTIKFICQQGIYMKKGGFVDARINGSQLFNDTKFTNESPICLLRSDGPIRVEGGQYSIDGNAGYALWFDDSAQLNNININAKITRWSDTPILNTVLGIFKRRNGTLTLTNSTIYTVGSGKMCNARGLNVLKSDVDINNCEITALGNYYLETVNGENTAHSSMAIFIANQTQSNTVKINNSKLYGSGEAIHAQEGYANGTIENSDFLSHSTAIEITSSVTDSKIAIRNSTIKQTNTQQYIVNSFKNGIVNDSNSTQILLYDTSVSAVNSAIKLTQGKIYISMCNIQSSSKQYASSTAQIFLGLKNNITKSNFNNPNVVVESNSIYQQFPD